MLPRHGVHKGRNAQIMEDRLTVKRLPGSTLVVQVQTEDVLYTIE